MCIKYPSIFLSIFILNFTLSDHPRLGSKFLFTIRGGGKLQSQIEIEEIEETVD